MQSIAFESKVKKQQQLNVRCTNLSFSFFPPFQYQHGQEIVETQ